MRIVRTPTFDDWRTAARRLIGSNTRPADLRFEDGVDPVPSLFGTESASEIGEDSRSTTFSVPGRFLEIASLAAYHRDPRRFDLLYRVVWRLTRGGEERLLEVATDDDVHRLREMSAAVRRDEHKMHAFVRFRRVTDERGERFVAWYRPDHRILEVAAPFFARRFPSMQWSILTPDGVADWDLDVLRFGPPLPRAEAPADDELEDLWRAYYRSIFNPARTSVRTMVREMPVRHWPTLPEMSILDEMLEGATTRVEEMIAHREGSTCSAADHLPKTLDLPSLRAAAAACVGCELHGPATQTVFGMGPEDARLVIVGEQPGDEEDRVGRPFVGPAGRVLNEILVEAGVDRRTVYVTNAVKHFKYTPSGKRRLHQKPNSRELAACRPWLEAELFAIRPRVVLCLGATAASAVIGPDFRITQRRGEVLRTRFCETTLATYHPSMVLRGRAATNRERVRRELLADVSTAIAQLSSS